ncbi:GPP34 family phosphoprotein [Rhodococcus sp. NPDC058505]|uniref:GOLPH3/VPS74 family protein n=1 Tax=unclassified Rhodococcus (in: high G+C Gram-positive bacteria) TaxID=192944 RepID=UPI0036679271
MTLLAEDLLLLLLDDDTGKPVVDGMVLPRALAGAVLLELTLDGVVEPADGTGAVKKGRLVLRNRTAPLDPILAHAVAQLRGSKPMKPEAAIEKLGTNLREAVLGRIVERGWVSESTGKLLGIFPTKTWPSVDATHERVVRGRLRAALVDGGEPDPRTAALIALLSAADAVPRVLPDVKKKAVRARAKEIAHGNWAAAAVRQSVDVVNAAVIAAVVVPAVAAGGS